MIKPISRTNQGNPNIGKWHLFSCREQNETRSRLDRNLVPIVVSAPGHSSGRNRRVFYPGRVFGCLEKDRRDAGRDFMIRLETAKRTLQEAVPSISSHFVPIAATGELRFKERRERPAEAVQ